jgi:preprotein translocase subunit Sec63
MTVAELKKQYKTFAAAKAAKGIKAKSWVALAQKLTQINAVAQPLTLEQLKQAIYNRFDAASTATLKKSKNFNMAIDGLGKLNLALKATWENLYRKFIGILPNETTQQGANCINGINIFDYFKPWQVFNLDPQTATKADIKKAYRDLSKIYHPDAQGTGNATIFERLHIMYKSILAGV